MHPMQARSPRNRTLACSEGEMEVLGRALMSLHSPASLSDIAGRVIHQDIFSAAPHLPAGFVDLLILDPPFNVTKNYDGSPFRERRAADYQLWFKSLIDAIKPSLRQEASVYVCSDWKTSVLIAPILNDTFNVRNRITWEREKGRGALRNWKNNAEDIWFCTMSKRYTFNVNEVKIKRRVIAPYRTEDGTPKDWQGENGDNCRMTSPSNIWTDISVPFWSMRENTDHPTQKPEKLLAKLVLAAPTPATWCSTRS